MLAEKEVAAPAPSINTDPIFIAIEISRSKWVVGTHIPTSSKVSVHTVEWGDAAALLALVERLRSRAADILGIADVPVLCCYEAGYEGFWLYRRLAAAGLRVLVIDPSSLLVNRRAKRAKTDRIDAKAMIRALMAYNRGEDQVLSAVNVPSAEQEDHRRLVRERQSLVYDCTAHTNRIRGLLLTQGIVGFDPRASGAERQLDELMTGDGRSLGPRLKDEMRREIAPSSCCPRAAEGRECGAQRYRSREGDQDPAPRSGLGRCRCCDDRVASPDQRRRSERRIGARARGLLAQVQQPT